MTTQIFAHQIHSDHEIAVTLAMDIEAEGSPEQGWRQAVTLGVD